MSFTDDYLAQKKKKKKNEEKTTGNSFTDKYKGAVNSVKSRDIAPFASTPMGKVTSTVGSLGGKNLLAPVEEELAFRKRVGEIERTLLNSPEFANTKYWEEALPKAADAAVVRTAVNKAYEEKRKKKEKEANSFFKKTELFEDGWDFGDGFKVAAATGADVAENMRTGLMGMGEKAWDFLLMAGEANARAQSADAMNAQIAADAFTGGKNTENIIKMHDQAQDFRTQGTEELIKKDLYDEAAISKKITEGTVGWMGVDTEANSILGGKADAIAQSGGQLIGQGMLSALGVPWFVTSFATSAGGEMENALNEGATFEQAAGSSLITGAAEVATEKLFGGDIFTKGTGSDLMTKYLATAIKNKTLRGFAKAGIDIFGEGFEESATEFIGNFGTKLYKEENLKELLFSEQAFDEYLDAAIGGWVMGGFMTGSNAVESKLNGKDFATELTKNEKSVVDKVYEGLLAEKSKDGKLSAKDKADLWDSIVTKMDRGEISTGVIEEMFGGETYKKLQDITESEKKIIEKLSQQYEGEELKTHIESLLSNSERDGVQEQLSKEVAELIKDDRLFESYRQDYAGKQKFTADLNQYDEKQRATVQKAIESGVLNNRRKTHELVDLIARISADKGVPFDFTNNKKLAESGYGVEGKTVNGFVTESGDVIINSESTKYLNSVVGHEITHVLEGTEMYDALKETLESYAKGRKASDSKFENEYEERLDHAINLYENIKGYQGVDGFARIEREVVADLVGDYLFTDENFVQHLSTTNHKGFMWLWDEVKYLAKVATAGSKEARDLERVKKAFENAYKADKVETTKTGADYSVGWHAGDLGKAESYAQQGGGRSTGHFGTGTYFVGDEAKIMDDYSYGKRPHHSVDFDGYNLYKVYDDKTGYELHDQLKVIDGGFSQGFLDAAKADKIRASSLRQDAWDRAEKYDTKVFDEEFGVEVSNDFIGSNIRAMTEVAQENDVEIKSFDEWIADEGLDAEDAEYYDSDYYDYLKETLEQADEERNHGYSAFERTYFKLWLKHGRENVNRALQAVIDHDAKMAESDYDTLRVSDSRATVFMKALGYEGIDVRGTGLDNTTYGSVIYDLKGDGLAKKKEIGTARYSVSDNDGRELTKGQQEYFKDSKMRDDDGNLMVMYHGSQDAGFHVFDASMSDDGTSFFFVDRNDVAATYSGTSETYEAMSIHSAEDMRNFLQSIGYDGYEVFEEGENHWIEQDGDYVAGGKTWKELYEEFCWYEGIGNGDANYKVYLNLKNPLVVDAEGRSWNDVSREFSQETADKYHSLTTEEQAALHSLAEWEDFSLFRYELNQALRENEVFEQEDYDVFANRVRSAYGKLSGNGFNMYDLFSIASENFSEESLKEFAVKQMTTRDYAQRAKEQGYDGVIFKNIHDNGGFSNGSEGASTVAIAFDSNQIKSVANENPTADKDIRYSLSEDSEGRKLTDNQSKYFADSKVVDDNGNLQVVYHGSGAEFTEFSYDFMSTHGSMEGQGFYFTDNETMASYYQKNGAKLMKGYLDIKKPLSDSEVTLKRSELTKLLKAIDPTGDDVVINYDPQGGMGYPSKVWYNRALAATVDAIYDSSESDSEILADLANSGAGTETVVRKAREVLGYDGYIVKGKYEGSAVYVAFESNQFKNIDNLNPTVDPDVRRSLSAEGEAPKAYGDYRISSEDVAYKDIAPAKMPQETAKTEQNVPIAENVAPVTADKTEAVENMFPDEMTEDEEFDSLDMRRADIETKFEELIAAEDWDTFAKLNDEYTEVMTRLADLEARITERESGRLDSLDDSIAPPVVEQYDDSPVDIVSLTKTVENDIARDVRGWLGVTDPRKMGAVREIIRNYAQNENPNREDLADELRRKFGTYEETSTPEEEIKEAKKFLRRYPIRVSDSVKGDIPDFLTDFKKRNKFKLLLRDDARMGIDEVYRDLNDRWPDLFPLTSRQYDVETLHGQLMRMEYVANLAGAITETRQKSDEEIYGAADAIIQGMSDYRNTLKERDSMPEKGYFDSLMAEAENLAPVAESTAPTTPGAPTPPTAPIAPIANDAPAAKSEEESHRAKILFGKDKSQPKRNKVLDWVKEHIFRHGAVFEDLALKTGNRELQARFDSIRRAEGRAQNFIGKGNKEAKALLSIRKEVMKAGKLEPFNYYLYHLHNVDRMTLEERFKDTPNKAVFGDVSAEDSRKSAAYLEAQNPEFKQWAEDIYGINRYLRKMLVENGVISQKTADLWEKMYPHYIPIGRVGQFGLNVNVPLDSMKTGVNAPIKRATGGNSDMYDLFDVMGSRIEQTYKAVAKNRFGTELKNTLGTIVEAEAEQHGILPEGTRVRAHDRENVGTIKSYNEATGQYTVFFENQKGQSANVLLDRKIVTPLNPNGIDEIIDSIDQHEELLQEGKNGMSPTFTVFENGERVKFAITEQMYDAMKPSSFNGTIGFLSWLNDIRRDILTTYNPTFAITNPIKDIGDILINSQHPVRTYANIPEAIWQMVKKGQYYQERTEAGGAQDSYFDGQSKTYKEKSTLSKAIGFPFEAIKRVNEAIEQIPRLAEYIVSRKMGRSIDVSMLDAARVTTNFGAPGDFTNMLNRNGATFLSASVEGFNQQVRNIREAKAEGLKGWAKLAGKFAAAGLPAMLLNHLLWDDDEEYAQLSDYVKQNYYIVGKFGDGQFVRIPKGRAVAVIQDAFVQMENLITGNDDVDLESFANLVMTNIAPNNVFDNWLGAPIVQAINNNAWYGGDLVPTRLQDLPTEEQYDESTDSISRWLAENFDPFGLGAYKINYILDQYSGGVGDMILPYLTPEADGGGLGAAFTDKFTTDSVFNNQNVTDFYTKVDELKANAKSIKATDDDILMSKYMNSVNDELSALYSEKRRIQNSKILDDETKMERIRRVQEEINDLTADALNSYEDINYEGNYAEIGGTYFEWYEPEKGDAYWRKLSDSQTTKYLLTKDATGHYVTDGEVHYRLDKDGEWTKISDKQLARQREVTKKLGITPDEYWSKTDISFLPMSDGEYEYAFDNPENYAVAKAVGGYDSYRTYSKDLYNIKADKDSNGKSINGSRKAKVLDYINNMDADYYTKIILWKSEYPSDDSYNDEILEYLNSRDDISYEETVAILEELGAKVDSNGNVKW